MWVKQAHVLETDKALVVPLMGSYLGHLFSSSWTNNPAQYIQSSCCFAFSSLVNTIMNWSWSQVLGSASVDNPSVQSLSEKLTDEPLSFLRNIKEKTALLFLGVVKIVGERMKVNTDSGKRHCDDDTYM